MSIEIHMDYEERKTWNISSLTHDISTENHIKYRTSTEKHTEHRCKTSNINRGTSHINTDTSHINIDIVKRHNADRYRQRDRHTTHIEYQERNTWNINTGTSNINKSTSGINIVITTD